MNEKRWIVIYQDGEEELWTYPPAAGFCRPKPGNIQPTSDSTSHGYKWDIENVPVARVVEVSI